LIDKFRRTVMSTTHLIYDSGNMFLPSGAAVHQIGPTLDVRKYSKIRVVAEDLLAPFGDAQIFLAVKEGNITVELEEVILFGPGVRQRTVVYDVPGRHLEIFVRDLAAPKRLVLLIFGLEE
jgi:hypothetical protein